MGLRAHGYVLEDGEMQQLLVGGREGGAEGGAGQGGMGQGPTGHLHMLRLHDDDMMMT